MLLSTTAFNDGEIIPGTYAEPDAGGDNVSPALEWSEVPAEAKSLAITVYDPDAPTGSGFWHWIAFNLPPSTTSVPEGGPLPEGAIEWTNDNGVKGYSGAFPPAGRIHRYIFTVHALETEDLGLPAEATNAQARFAILGSEIESVSITGKFQRPTA